ncbi:MAG: hypothetical protein DHS20C15_20270 [Planctomycetota bacterium]|nr:MAG: hypothetical protein DHS20C15_20270 [Planctomycetota bacterium]
MHGRLGSECGGQAEWQRVERESICGVPRASSSLSHAPDVDEHVDQGSPRNCCGIFVCVARLEAREIPTEVRRFVWA